MDSASVLDIPTFKVGERVFAPDERGHLYLGSIQKITHYNALVDGEYINTWRYLVHYIGWCTRHDAWVVQELIHPESEEIRIKAVRDREASAQQQKLFKLKRKLEANRNGDSTANTKKRVKKKRVEEETTSVSPPPIKLVQQTTYSQALVPKCILLLGRTRRQSTEECIINVAITLLEETMNNEYSQPQNISTINKQSQPQDNPPYFCARLTPLDSISKSSNHGVPGFITASSFRDSARQKDSSTRCPSKDDGESDVKNTRIRQRKLLKKSSLSVEPSLDMNSTTDLVGCEQRIIFGKSRVHGWGVYAKELIKAGEFIIEYRGILIGNALADKREKIYERAQIGSDYMFRVDAHTVVDATRKGNLARYINASCTPNCLTRIFATNGTKKIGIYAKRDICPGEELNYDYKFAPEKDEMKRILCRCGSFDCRGFMNWDKRYDTKT